MTDFICNLVILIIFIIWIIIYHYYGYKPEHFINYNNYSRMPFFYGPQFNYYSNMISGYDSATRSYYNPYYAQQIAQDLEN